MKSYILKTLLMGCMVAVALQTVAVECTISGPAIVVINPTVNGSSSPYTFTVKKSDNSTPSGTWSISSGGSITSQSGANCSAYWTTTGYKTISFTEQYVCSTSLTVVAIDQNSVAYGYDAAGNRVSRSITLRTKSDIEENPEIDTISTSSPTRIAHQSRYPTLEDTLSVNGSIRVFPNPTRGSVQLEVLPRSGETAQPAVAVFDAQGHPVMQLSAFDQKSTVDLSQHAAGNYVLVLRLGDRVAVWNIVKEE